MARHASFVSALVLGSISLAWSGSAVAMPGGDAVPASLLIAQMGARLERTGGTSETLPPPGLAWSDQFDIANRVDLGNMKVRRRDQSIGPIELGLTAARTISPQHRIDLPLAVDQWTLRSAGVGASLPLLFDVALVMDAEYARMSRRLTRLEMTPHGPATAIARLGGGLAFGGEGELMLDYVSVARSRRQDDVTLMAEAMGGAPATGHGPELTFALGSGTGRGQGNWRLSLASMRRPLRDVGLVANDVLRSDARALLSFNLHL